MLTYEAKRWEESMSRGGDYRSLLFSTPENFNMSRGNNRYLKVTSARFPVIGTSLLRVTSSGHEIDVTDEKFLTIMLPTQGATRVRTGRDVRVIREGAALAFGPSERWSRVDRCGHRDFRAKVAKIDLQGAGRAKILPSLANDPIIPIAPAALEGFRGLVRYLFADLCSPVPTLAHQPASDLFAALVLEHLRHLLASDRANPALDGSHHALVRSAIDYMVAFSSDPLTVPSIAEAVGVSTRQLQDAFRLTTGQSPWEQLTSIRLEKARSQLLSGAGFSVTDIALSCGFSHLGRFSQTYRAIYGETPSATLRRAKGATVKVRTAIRTEKT